MIAVTDNVQAKLFKADGREVNLVHLISKKLEPMEQERSAVMTGAGRRSAGPGGRPQEAEPLGEALRLAAAVVGRGRAHFRVRFGGLFVVAGTALAMFKRA